MKLSVIRVAFLLPVIFLCSGVLPADAITFYLDASGGDDTNSGTSAAQAWKSLQRLNQYKWNTGFAPGDEIRFKRGEVFVGNLSIDEQSGTADNPILYSAYGSGPLPVIEGEVQIDSQSWIIVEELDIRGNAAGSGVVIRGDLDHTSSHVTIRGNLIQGYGNAGISIEGGGIHDITVSDNTISGGYVGIYMASDTGADQPNVDKDNDQPLGCNNLIEGNEIYGNSLTGIALDALGLKEYAPQFICDGSNPERGRNTVRNNTIRDNGGHGIEITSNHILVEGNLFEGNGRSTSLGGFSGIHLFDRWPEESGPDSDRYERGGDHNIIRGNTSRFNRDRVDRTDGNGIQMDMWCDANQVYNNIAYGNDGAGIIVFGGSNNEVYNNTLYDNGRDIGLRYGANELVVISAEVDYPDAADVTNEAGKHLLVAKENRVINNIALAVASDSPEHPYYEGYIDCRTGDCRYGLAVGDYCINDVESVGNTMFAHNLWYNTQHTDQAIAVIRVSRDEHFQVPPGSTDVAAWNGRDVVSGDLVAQPLFVDAANANFHLLNATPRSPAVDAGLPLPLVTEDFDHLVRPQGAGWDMGALETAAGCSLALTLADSTWQLISLPCAPPEEANTAAACFGDDIDGTYNNSWVMYRYDAVRNGYVNVGADGILVPGVGYWILQVGGADVSLRLPEGSSPPAIVPGGGCSSETGCFPVSLETRPAAIQWNMVGYPDTTPQYFATTRIQTSSGDCINGCDPDTAATHGIIHNQLWRFGEQGYQAVNSTDFLTPWTGYWCATREEADGRYPVLLFPRP